MSRPFHVSAVFASTLLLALWGVERETATQSSNASYGITDLGTIGGDRTIARGMSSGGFPRVVGSGTTSTGEEHAFEGNARGISDLGTLGGARSEAFDTNGGRAVGRAQLPSGAFHAFLSDWPGLIDLGTLGGSESHATAINVPGVVVGASLMPGDASTRAFVYEDGTMTLLPATLGGRDVVANDINDADQVVGYAQRSGGLPHHAFLYANGATIDLGSLGGTSEASAINNDGIIAGRSQTATGAMHAFRHQHGVMQDLGTLGGASSEALDINSGGVIVGWAENGQGQRRAFVWRDNVMTDLNTLIRPGTGWVLEAATGIGNGAAAIVGYGRLNGHVRAFFLTPPLDLAIDLRRHFNQLDTNIPNPHETGKILTLGVTVSGQGPYSATGITISDTISGPVEYVDWSGGDCVQNGQRLTCNIGSLDFDRDFFARVRSTGPGVITHSASVTADQPDPSTANNSATESNTAVSLASLTINPTIVTGGQSPLARVTLTSRAHSGGATIKLTSSRPDSASVPSPWEVLSYYNDGTYREFYVTTKTVSAPVTVDISATYGLVTQTIPLTIMPQGSQWPYGNSARQIPGTIQAEDFDEGGEGAAYHDVSPGNDGNTYRSSDVDVQPTGDAGGGYNVGWTSAGEWLEYTTNVATTGTYTLEARVASPGAGGSFHIELDGTNKTGTMTVPDTGGWQTWTTVSKSIVLEAGLHILRVSVDGNGSSGAFGNLNYLRFVAASATPGPTPYGGTPRAIPGTIQAEDFDEGGEGVAYHDSGPNNAGGAYRPTGVDIAGASDIGGGYTVGWMTAGEWLNYTVSVAQSGTYSLAARVAANGTGGTFHVEFDGVNKTGSLTIPNTGGWQNWVDVTATVTLGAGTQSMRFVADQNGPAGVFGNLNQIKLSSVAASDVVLYSTDLTLHGAWFRTADTSAAAGQKALTPDTGWSTTSTPLANPADYVEATFDAPANTPYRLWVRLRGTGDTKFSESVWVQFSDALANGGSIYPIGSTSGLLVNLEPCYNCGISGWGWQNGAYWLEQPTTVTFATAGRHTMRIQVREDGAQIDQIVLSPSRYLASAPGPVRNDATIVGK
jgi:probable HAF family extracellular repeat protein